MTSSISLPFPPMRLYVTSDASRITAMTITDTEGKIIAHVSPNTNIWTHLRDYASTKIPADPPRSSLISSDPSDILQS